MKQAIVVILLMLSIFRCSGAAAAKCDIKGITYGGAKIYYLPTHPQYSKITVNEKKGDWWLCSEDEAREFGFRKAPENPRVDSDGVITNGDLLDRKPMTMERVFRGVLNMVYPYGLKERNLFDQVSSNYYYISSYLWLDAWGTKDQVNKILILARFPPNMTGNSINQQQITKLLNNIFPEVPDMVNWVFQATQQDIQITRTSNQKSIRIESIVVVHQLTIFIEFNK